MAKLQSGLNLKNPDDFYAELLKTHEGLGEGASAKLNMKLVLLLANHIGDLPVLQEALEAAKEKGGR